MSNRKIALFSVSMITIFILILGFSLNSFNNSFINQKGNTMSINYQVNAEITFKKNGKVVYHFSGLDALTNQGLNLTFCKLTGDNTFYNMTTYNMNTTRVSLGNYTTALSSSSTNLGGEWIRVSGTIHAQAYNGFNITGTFSGLTGTNSSNCMGIEYGGATMNNNDLWGYITFSQITGIDSSFTITAEIQVIGTTS
jgi:hypothetical protein